MKKKTILAALLIPVVLIVLECNGILYMKRTVQSVDINSGRYKQAKYILGIKVSEVNTKSEVTQYFKKGQNEDWKICHTLSGFFIQVRGSGSYGQVMAQLHFLPTFWKDSILTEDEKREQVSKLSAYWRNDELEKANQYFNSLNAYQRK